MKRKGVVARPFQNLKSNVIKPMNYDNKKEFDKMSVQVILNVIKRESFTSPETTSNEEAMGLLMSKFFEWDGVKILKATSSALEDANFHSECQKVEDMIVETEAKFNK